MFNFSSNNHHVDPDDFFADTRMSFGDHLEDLRVHLWRAIAGFGVALVFGFIVGRPLLAFISSPVEAELKKYWDNYYKKKHAEVREQIKDGTLTNGEAFDTEVRLNAAALKEGLGLKTEPSDKDRLIKVPAQLTNVMEWASEMKRYETDVGRRAVLSTLRVEEGFMVYFKVSLVAGFIIASPWIFYQIWSFIAAGLYPHEKRYINVFLPVSIALFLAGVLICQFFVIPKAIEALLWFNEWLNFEPDLRLNEWLSFAIFMPVVFGLSFQTPLVMLFLNRLGIMEVSSFRSKRRIAWFVMAVFAAVVTPSVDAISMLYLWVPMGLLYELGILLCVMSPKREMFDVDEPESGELIEV